MTKTAFVTGATAGIGKHIAIGLAKQGTRVIMGARNADKARTVREEVVGASNNKDVSVAIVDVSSIASVRALDLGIDRLDVLVNNAGTWLDERTLSADGIELTFATNVLGPYLVTRTLQPRFADDVRIVNVVSAFASHYDATDLEWSRRAYDGFKAYKQSKQALRMLTWGLATRLAGTKMTANAAAPGFVKTDFTKNVRNFTAAMINLAAKLFAVTAAKGADTPLWVATAPELEGVTGRYFDARKDKDGKFREPEPIADLERRCDEMLAAKQRAA